MALTYDLEGQIMDFYCLWLYLNVILSFTVTYEFELIDIGQTNTYN